MGECLISRRGKNAGDTYLTEPLSPNASNKLVLPDYMDDTSLIFGSVMYATLLSSSYNYVVSFVLVNGVITSESHVYSKGLYNSDGSETTLSYDPTTRTITATATGTARFSTSGHFTIFYRKK